MLHNGNDKKSKTRALLAVVPTIEKRFELSSTISGIMLAGYDI